MNDLNLELKMAKQTLAEARDKASAGEVAYAYGMVMARLEILVSHIEFNTEAPK